MNDFRSAVAAIAMSLAACSGDPDSEDGSVGPVGGCLSLAGQGAVVTLEQTNCPACLSNAQQQAVDGDLDTAASLVAPSVAAGFAGMRATVAGASFAGGSTAAVILSNNGDPYLEVLDSTVMRTYLEGALQEEYFYSTNAVGGNVVSGHSAQQFKMPTTKAFDAIEFGVSGTVENLQLDFFEFCSDL